MNERPVLIDCEGDALIGILCVPRSPCAVGVTIVVGGPQYRVGSHRQFVQLARKLGETGIASLRFDIRGMGDSGGVPRSFEHIGPDIIAAANVLLAASPSIRCVVLWGLCDGASAALMTAPSTPRLIGVVAVNPWVRSETTLDRALVKAYYGQRLLSREFWFKLLGGDLNVRQAIGEFGRRLRSAFSGQARIGSPATSSEARSPRFQDRMLEGLMKANVPVLLLLSGQDITAQEFVAFIGAESRWNSALADPSRSETKNLPGADHTFSSTHWRAEVERLTCEFVASLCSKIDPVERT